MNHITQYVKNEDIFQYEAKFSFTIIKKKERKREKS